MTKPTNVLLDQSLRAIAKRRARERGLSLSASWETRQHRLTSPVTSTR